MKPYVFVTRKISEEALRPLREIADIKVWPEDEVPVSREVLLDEASRASALFTMVSDPINKELFDLAPNLQVVANMAVGFDNINVEEATQRGIIVCHTPDVLTDTTADLTFALLMATARRLVEASNYIKEGQWKEWSPLLLAGYDIHHKKIGIIGMGRIGEAVAKRATGFDMEILYHNRTRKPEAEKALNAKYVSFDEVIEDCDFVVSMVPYTNETKGIFNEGVFKAMKKTAIFINASRGGVVNEEALYQALQYKEIAAAGLDVFSKEPIGAEHPLLTLPNVVALPHIGSASYETRGAMVEMTVENIIRVLQGTEPLAVVNKEVLSSTAREK
ncbi:2-hydroxyacid dehydrogenase [Bacillus sp. FJAT-45350]|uniref:2-hydroxyacid dehydrogenase n=1 Tax=Bacillus sp. FJAT-45350 TaxID=2011014 RepID=UPI000BB737CE|nr:D-glycerate dehydrogenase [Bacillus sp. FJAT-45350]